MFDIHQKVHDKYGEREEGAVEEYIGGLMEEFAASPEARPVIESAGCLTWAAMMMDYCLNYCGVTPAAMSVRNFEEVVFELFPRKVSVEAEKTPEIVAELRAFWHFVDRQYALSNARKILARFDDGAAGRLQKELANPSNYGMAKSFFMQGMKAGFDMTSQEGLDAFMLFYNSRLASTHGMLPPLPPEALTMLPIPGDVDRGSRDEREARRKLRKRQRQARKKHRR